MFDSSTTDKTYSGNTDYEINTKTVENSSSNQSAVISDTSISTDGASLIGEYRNEQASIKLYEYHYESTAVYVADIVVSSSEYIKTAFLPMIITVKTSLIRLPLLHSRIMLYLPSTEIITVQGKAAM